MIEPTLTELREMAVKLVEEKRMCPCKLCRNTNGRAVIDAFLSLTDPTPLTVEHCREAGMPMTDEGLDQRYSLNGTHAWKHYKCDEMSLDISEPTLGQLRMALLQENRE